MRINRKDVICVLASTRDGSPLSPTVEVTGCSSLAGVISKAKESIGTRHRQTVFSISNKTSGEHGKYNNCGSRIK